MFATQFVRLLGEMLKSLPGLTLTGSYAFGNITTESDIDFFIQDDSVVADRLKALGFKLDSVALTGAYNDALSSKVYKHPCGKVHVQVVVDAKWKLRAQRMLLEFPYKHCMVTMEKESKKKLWNWAIERTKEREG